MLLDSISRRRFFIVTDPFISSSKLSDRKKKVSKNVGPNSLILKYQMFLHNLDQWHCYQRISNLNNVLGLIDRIEYLKT